VAHKYEFDEAYQKKILTLMLRDAQFNQRTEGLILPEYFENAIFGSMVRVLQDYWQKYKRIPSQAILATVMKQARADKVIRDELFTDVITLLKTLLSEKVTDREFVINGVEEFAQHQAMENAILTAAELLESSRDYAKIDKVIKSAQMVGAAAEEPAYDFYKRIEERTEVRKEKMAGVFVPQGITTGVRQIDKLLMHRGWGRKELSCLMGPAKSGKSMGLIGFGLNASRAGYHVIYLSCEVSKEIIAERSDANISDIPINDLEAGMGIVRSKVETAKAKAGSFDLYDFPPGSLTATDIRRLLNKMEARGKKYDLIIIDYADIMAPEVRVRDDSIENSKQIYLGLRAVAHEFDAAVLTATQTNREGFKATVAGMTHVADDINKARTVDLLISINSTEDERARGECRLYFAASRNQEGDMTIRVKSAKEKGKLITKVIELM